MPQLETPDGARLHYEIHGHGPSDLLFLHGVPGTGSIWQRVVALLDPAVFRSIVVDLRGHGHSSPGRASVDYAQIHRDLILIGDVTRSTSACCVAHSGSGKNAIWWAAHAPTRAHGLFLVAPTGCRTLPIPRETVAALIATAPDPTRLASLVGEWFRLGCGPGYDAYLRSLEHTRPSVVEQTMAMWSDTSVETQARSLTLPVCLVVGTEERVYTPEYLRQNLLPQLSHARLEMLAAGHLIPLDAPALLARLLTDHCAQPA